MEDTKYRCRRCLPHTVNERELAQYLDGYVESLPEEMRVPPEIYHQRILQCATCAHHINLTCLQCGCYVQARAAKRVNSCPIAGSPRWAKYTGGDPGME